MICAVKKSVINFQTVNAGKIEGEGGRIRDRSKRR